MESATRRKSRKRRFSDISHVPHERVQLGPDPGAFYFDKPVSQRDGTKASEPTETIQIAKSKNLTRTVAPLGAFPLLFPKIQPNILKEISRPHDVDKASSYTKDQWLSMKDTIRRLWLVEDKTFINSKRPQDGVQEILKIEYGFSVTKRQFTRKIEEWGFGKNITNREMRIMDKIQRHRQHRFQKKTEFHIRGEKVPEAKLLRWQQRQKTEMIPWLDPRTHLNEMPEWMRPGWIFREFESMEMGISYNTPKVYHPHCSFTVSDTNRTTEDEEEEIEVIERNTRPSSGGIFNTSTLEATGAPSLDMLLSIMCLNEARSGPQGLGRGKMVHGNDALKDGKTTKIYIKQGVTRTRQKVNKSSKLTIGSYISPLRIVGVNKPLVITRFPHSLWPQEEQTDYWVEEKFTSQEILLELHSKGSRIGNIIPVVKKLANAFGELNDSIGQMAALQHTLKLTLRLRGKEHRDTVLAWYEIAKYFGGDASWEIEPSEKIFIKQLQSFAKTLNEDDPLFINIMELGTKILRAKKEYKSAEYGQRQLIRIALTNQHVTTRFLLQLLEDLGETLHIEGSYIESEEVKLTLINLQHSGKFDITLTEIIAAQASLAKTYRAQGKYQQSISMLRTSIASWTQTIAADSEDLVPARTELANTLRMVGRWEEALKIHQPMQENREKWNLSAKYPRMLESLLDYAQGKYYYHDYGRALEIYFRVLEEFRCADRVILGCDVSYIYDRIAWTYWMMNDWERSELFFAKAKEAWDMVEPRVRQYSD